jgi:thioredoxin-related protein
MSKSRVKKKPGNKKAPQKKHKNYSKLIKNLLITCCFLAVIAVPIVFYSENLRAEHDLSVIGNGIPTIVQIHDPGCQLCQQLKRNVDSLKGDYKDKVNFKTANIKTTKGRRFAQQYGVPHVTLLFFNEKGLHINTLEGVTSSQRIKNAVDRLL